MNTGVEVSFSAPYYELNKKTSFSSKGKYQTFVNWVSGEFDLYIQDEEPNRLSVFFPEGNFHIKNEIKNGAIIADINLETKLLEKGELIFSKIMSVYALLVNN
jgi:hypothetical protein